MTPPLRPTSILDRASFTSHSASSVTPLQSQVDGLVGGFVEQATDLKTLAAISAGGMAYRMGRVGLMGLGSGNAVRALSVVGGLGAEVSAFEATHRGLASVTGGPGSANLWRWDGAGGLRQGLISSMITFGTLKGAGCLAQGQNVFVQHLMQDSAMVLGHQSVAALGFGPRPLGSLAEQFLHAEATNLQLGAGMALLHGAAPGLTGLERGLDLITPSPLSLSLEGEGGRRSGEGGLTRRFEPALAASGGRGVSGTPPAPEISRPGILEMSSVDGPGNGSSPPASIHALEAAQKGYRELPAEWPANLPVEWASVRGSGLRTEHEVADTEALNRVIVEDGIKQLLGEEAIHSIFGYGSFEYFRNGKAENIRSTDLDKKPDYIVVGDNLRMIENLGRRWNLTAEQIASLKDHARFTPAGFREGFVFFNTDILVPGRGPVAFKISLVDSQAFFARRSRGPILEYSQIRLKDATERNLVWSRDPLRTLSHVEAIRDQMFDEAFLRMGGGITSLYNPLNLFRFKFRGRDLGRWFYRLSYRVEAYRFWENGFGSWDKGAKLFDERAEENRTILVDEFRRFALRNQKTLRVNGEKVDPSRIHLQITPQNLYDAVFTDVGITRSAFARSLRFWGSIPHYTKLNLRGLSSYIRHGLPANKLSQAYYRQPPEEYAGRKARRLVYPPGATRVHPVAKILAKPGIKRAPILNKIALDSVYYPVYYSDLAPFFNRMYRKGQIGDAEYDSLISWLATSPKLTELRDEPLLESLRELTNGSNPAGRQGAIRTFRAIESLPLLDPNIQQFIHSMRVPPRDTLPSLSRPAEIEEIMDINLPILNPMCAGKSPRIYDWLRLTLRRSLAEGSRLESLIDYIDQSEEGRDTALRQDVTLRNRNLDPKLGLLPMPEPRGMALETEIRSPILARPSIATAETLPAPSTGNGSSDGE